MWADLFPVARSRFVRSAKFGDNWSPLYSATYEMDLFCVLEVIRSLRLHPSDILACCLAPRSEEYESQLTLGEQSGRD